MEDIFKEELGRASVFRNASKLSPDFVPDRLPHREEEFRKLVNIFRPLLESQASQRVLITGSVGVGKTALARKFGEELVKEGAGQRLKLDYLHINCRKQQTPYSVLLQIVQHYNPSWPSRGVGTEKLLQLVVDHLEGQDKYLMLTLDELDYFVGINGPDLVYWLTRAGEEKKNRISIIAIAKESGFLKSLDVATQSTFMHQVLPLDKYNSKQLTDILNYRVLDAFKPGAVDEEAISLTSDIAARWGDARFALELLWRAGMLADEECSEQVMPDHVRRAKAEVYPEIKKEVIRDLKLHEKLLLLGIVRKLRVSKRAYLETPEAERSYKIACEEYGERPLKHTRLWEHFKQMERLGIINLKPGKPAYTASVQDIPLQVLEKDLEASLRKR